MNHNGRCEEVMKRITKLMRQVHDAMGMELAVSRVDGEVIFALRGEDCFVFSSENRAEVFLKDILAKAVR